MKEIFDLYKEDNRREVKKQKVVCLIVYGLSTPLLKNYNDGIIILGIKENKADGLMDRRECHKTEDEADELERLKRENLRWKQKGYGSWIVKKVKELEWMCKQLEISKTETFAKAIGGNPGAKPIFHSD